MNYQIEVSPEARKEIKALAGYVRTQARQLIRALGKIPVPHEQKNYAASQIFTVFGWLDVGVLPMKLMMSWK